MGGKEFKIPAGIKGQDFRTMGLEPFITGYFFAHFSLPPQWNEYNVRGCSSDIEEASKALESTTLSVKVDSLRASIGETIQDPGIVTISFLELSGLVISNIINKWYNIKSIYTAWDINPQLVCWITEPDGQYVDQLYVYNGINVAKQIDWGILGSTKLPTNGRIGFNVDFNYEAATVLDPKCIYAFIPPERRSYVNIHDV